MTDQTNIRKRSMLITLCVILFVVLVAILKNLAAERTWLNLEPVAEQVTAHRAGDLPLVLVGTFTGVLKNLRAFGKWSDTINKVSGALLILVGVYFLWVA